MFSLLELARGRVSVVNPDGDSKTGTETRVREGGVEQQNLHKAVACHTLSLPLLFTEVLVLQVLRTNPSEVY